MKLEQIAAAGLLIVGLFLLYSGFQATETLGEQLQESLTGRFSQTTTWYLIVGTLSTVGGIGLLSKPWLVAGE